MRAFTFCYRRGVAIADNAQSCAKAERSCDRGAQNDRTDLVAVAEGPNL